MASNPHPAGPTSRGTEPAIDPIRPDEIRIVGSQPIPRTLHQDPRGFLVETLRQDDAAVRGDRFVMSYTSVTVPGEFRDADRWHVHRVQTDRFVTPLGEMILALFDNRPDSPTRDRLEVIRMQGAPLGGAAHATKRELTIHLVPIPPGVFHCIGNLSEEPFVLQNYPTEYYDLQDEGRVPFAGHPIPALRRGFDWGLVRRSR